MNPEKEEIIQKAKDALGDKGTLLFITEVGSHLYGTNTEDSDKDYRGIFIPSLDSILSSSYKDDISVYPKSKNKNNKDSVDFDLWSIQKFIKLFGKNETNATDLWFSKLNRKYIYSSPDFVIPYKRFFSKNIKSYLGFALSQADKYGVKGTRINNVIDFTRHLESLDLPGNEPIKLHWNSWNLGNFKYIQRTQENDNVHIDYVKVLEKLIPGEWKVSRFIRKLNEMIDEFGARALSSRDGNDFKALSHAVRVLSETEEYLKDKFITFPLKEKDLILGIKNSNLTSQEISEEISYRLEVVRKLQEESELPDKIEQEFIRQTITDFIKDFYGIKI